MGVLREERAVARIALALFSACLADQSEGAPSAVAADEKAPPTSSLRLCSFSAPSLASHGALLDQVNVAEMLRSSVTFTSMERTGRCEDSGQTIA